MRAGQLLLVEDDADNREMLTILLSGSYSVASYGSAEEALEALEAVRPDLLLLDIGMKPVDGVRCLQAIRAQSGFSETSAIALTGFAREVDRQAFLAAGFQAVVTKPIVDYQALETLIDTLLQGAAPDVAETAAPRCRRESTLTDATDGRMILGRGSVTA